MWCVNVGHRREELAEVMYDQAMALSYNTPWYTMNAPSAELAERIAGHAPGDLSHVFFTTGGSSAVETALRFMQFYNNVRGRPEKKLILSRGGAYHGSTYLSASLNGRPRDRDWMDGADELVVKLSSPNPFRRPAGMSVEAFADFLVDEFARNGRRASAPDRIGAFVGEPVQASGGVIVPPDGYLKRIREICRAERHPLRFRRGGDRLRPARPCVRLGRCVRHRPRHDHLRQGRHLGLFPARRRDDLRPADGGTAALQPSRRHVRPRPDLYQPSGRLRGGAERISTCWKAACSSMRARSAPYFQARLKTLEELPLVGEVRGAGLMACVECVADRESNDPLQLDKDVGKRIDAHCHELGLLVRPLINMCVMSPPLVITPEQIDDMVGDPARRHFAHDGGFAERGGVAGVRWRRAVVFATGCNGRNYQPQMARSPAEGLSARHAGRPALR